MMTSTASILNAASLVVTSSTVLFRHADGNADAVIAAVTQLLGGSVSVMAAAMNHAAVPTGTVGVEIFTEHDDRLHRVHSESSESDWRSAGLGGSLDLRDTSDLSGASDDIVHINGVPLSTFIQGTDVRRIDVTIDVPGLKPVAKTSM